LNKASVKQTLSSNQDIFVKVGANNWKLTTNESTETSKMKRKSSKKSCLNQSSRNNFIVTVNNKKLRINECDYDLAKKINEQECRVLLTRFEILHRKKMNLIEEDLHENNYDLHNLPSDPETEESDNYFRENKHKIPDWSGKSFQKVLTDNMLLNIRENVVDLKKIFASTAQGTDDVF
jgi:hypothetical protein